MGFVLDNSIAMTWCFEDQQTPYSEAVLEALSNEEAHVPAIWPLEVLNVLLTAERRGRIPIAKSSAFVRLLRKLPIEVASEQWNTFSERVLELGRSRNLSAYDASYLELAERLQLPLASQDGRMLSGAADMGISLWHPA